MLMNGKSCLIPIINFRFFRMPSLISWDQKENIICTIEDVRGDSLVPPHGTTPAAVIKLRFFKSSEHINEKRMSNIAVSATSVSSVTL